MNGFGPFLLLGNNQLTDMDYILKLWANMTVEQTKAEVLNAWHEQIMCPEVRVIELAENILTFLYSLDENLTIGEVVEILKKDFEAKKDQWAFGGSFLSSHRLP